MKTFVMEVTYNLSEEGQVIHNFSVVADTEEEAMQQIEKLAVATQKEVEESNWDNAEIEYGDLCEEY